MKPRHGYEGLVQVFAAATVISLTYELSGPEEWMAVCNRNRFLGWCDVVDYSGFERLFTCIDSVAQT